MGRCVSLRLLRGTSFLNNLLSDLVVQKLSLDPRESAASRTELLSGFFMAITQVMVGCILCVAWWTPGDSNPAPIAYETKALTTELGVRVSGN